MAIYDQSADVLFMQRAMELALRGSGSVSPNPLVGCVIAHEDRIIGEGWHEKYGSAHAEVNAVSRVDDKSLLRESTVYVSLEPCAHFGKTPPCADMLAQHQVKRVVVAATDPNPLVSGKGIKKLRTAGITVETGLLQEEGIHLNRRFFTMILKDRPYIILKWAQTADGFMARENFDSKWISNAYARQLVHKWRTEEDAIMVGANTAHYDNPRLTARDWTGRNPLRIVIDRSLRLSDDLLLFDGSTPTLRYHRPSGTPAHTREERAEINDADFMTGVMRDLHVRRIQSILVEGGPTLLRWFITTGLWDEARIIVSPVRFGNGIAAPSVNTGMTGSDAQMDVRSPTIDIAGDKLSVIFNQSAKPVPATTQVGT